MDNINTDINQRTNHFYKLVWKEIKIPMRDGSFLAANLYQPDTEGQFPVLMTLGPYGKDIHYLNHTKFSHVFYSKVQDKSPLNTAGTPDPEFWVPQGYAVVRIDERGSNRSPGTLEVVAESLKDDYYDAIEWAGTQSWSNGKVGLLGFSYYAITQWSVAQEQPPHLACMVVWEGVPDLYADLIYAGGILNNGFLSVWWENNIMPRQYGKGIMPENELEKNRVDIMTCAKESPLRNDWWKKRSCDLDKVTVPFISAGNWFGSGLFSRGNIMGFKNASSKNKWLEMHIGSHFTEFYNEDSRAMQKQFLDYWLKGIETGLMNQPKVKIAMPRGAREFSWIYCDEYPLKNTNWTHYYLNASSLKLNKSIQTVESKVSYKGDRNKESAKWEIPMRKPFVIGEENCHRVIFKTSPLKHEMKLVGPMKLRVYASSSTDDMDIFVTLRDISPDGKEVVNSGCYTADYPISQGWLRASLRRIDESRSTEYKPYYTFDKIEKLIPDEVYPLDIEIWDSAMVIEKGHTIVLEIGSQDQSGCSLMMHTSEERNWNSDVTIYTGSKYQSYLLLPEICN
ncbi:CocE/NonD family hydrolase [Clostridium saccharobutylicum]|uniref:Cocaine esterase n=1 Tax=Clostridium saccharobutylicum TaxID=169679 RepID=A0A1S8MRI7_CLOSA|nr:CocE/NonD family hydrolase [Clostridium saccharobutylicum]OOM06778.1 cocaine esterase [Clostridium saccharobutylicum]